MTAFQINVSVTVDAGEKTLSLLRALTGQKSPQSAINDKAEEIPAEAAKAPEKAVSAPGPEQVVQIMIDPDHTEEEAAPTISDAELRTVVKETVHRVGPGPVKELFSEFGIPNSSECPMARRASLKDRLNKLTKKDKE